MNYKHKMKSTKRLLTIIAIIAIIGLAITACSSGGGGGGNKGNKGDKDDKGPLFSIKGTFKVKNSTIGFKLSDAPSYKRAATTQYAVSGELIDDDVIYELEGYYDPETGTYTVSAANSEVRYTIQGAYDDDGNSLGALATMVLDAETDPVSESFLIDDNASVSISGTLNKDIDTGLPDQAKGLWRFKDTIEGVTMEATLLVSEWTMITDVITTIDGNKEIESMNLIVVEVSEGANLDVVVSFPSYIGSVDQVKAAAKKFVSENFPPDTITYEDDPPMGVVDYPYYCVQENIIAGPDINWGNLSDAQWDIAMKWWQTNYLVKHLIGIGVRPDPLYQKWRLTFSSGNMLLQSFYSDEPEVSESYTQTKALTDLAPGGILFKR